MYMIKIFTSFLSDPIELKTTNRNSVIVSANTYANYVGNRVQIIDTNYYLKIVIDGMLSIDWNRCLFIELCRKGM